MKSSDKNALRGSACFVAAAAFVLLGWMGPFGVCAGFGLVFSWYMLNDMREESGR